MGVPCLNPNHTRSALWYMLSVLGKCLACLFSVSGARLSPESIHANEARMDLRSWSSQAGIGQEVRAHIQGVLTMSAMQKHGVLRKRE